MGESDQKPIEPGSTKRNLLCPECKASLSTALFEKSASSEARCPKCNTEICLPKGQGSIPRPDKERLAPKCPFAIQVKYKSGQEFRFDYTKNVSKGGMFIKADNPPEPGTKVHLELCVPELSEPLLLYGEAVNKQKYTDNTDTGVGVDFQDIDPISRGILMNYLKSLSD